jgi:hypothetical protein
LNVFYIAFGVLAFGALFYTVFASGNIQSWAIVPDRSVSAAVLDTFLPQKSAFALSIIQESDDNDLVHEEKA